MFFVLSISPSCSPPHVPSAQIPFKFFIRKVTAFYGIIKQNNHIGMGQNKPSGGKELKKRQETDRDYKPHSFPHSGIP